METSLENKYLIEEKISKLFLKFSIPCVTGLLIGSFYNIIDQIFIGNSELGYLGNAATGVSFPLICIANACAWSVGDGSAAFLSICAGQKDSTSAHKCVGSCITLTLIISIVLVILGHAFAEPLLRIFGASDQTIGMAVEYFRIVVSFFPFYLLVNVTGAMIRADGSPNYSMIATLIGAIINIALDPLFIFVFKWGIAGAAWATVIAQVISCIACLAYFRHPKTFKLDKQSFIPDKAISLRTVTLGISTFITQISLVVITLICNMTLFHYGELSAYGPDIPISVFSIETKVYTIVINVIVGFSLGGQPIFGYNYGAGKIDRVRKAYSLCLISSLTVSLIATLIFQLWPQAVIRMFGPGNALYMEFAVKTFRIFLLLLCSSAMMKLTTIFFQAIGKPAQAIVAALARDIISFAPLALLLPYFLEKANAGTGIYGLLYAGPIADAISLVVITCITVPFFKNLRKIEREASESNK